MNQVPDPEVPAKARTRQYTAAYKAKILDEYEALDKAGKGSLLRREGLYTSLIGAWKKQRDQAVKEALDLVAEGDRGGEEAASFADGFVAAADFGGPGAVAVAEQSSAGFGVEAAHVGSLGLGGQGRGVVEGLDLAGDGEVFVRYGAVGDTGVRHRHAHRLVAEKGCDGFQAHSAVDGLGGQGVT